MFFVLVTTGSIARWRLQRDRADAECRDLDRARRGGILLRFEGHRTPSGLWEAVAAEPPGAPALRSRLLADFESLAENRRWLARGSLRCREPARNPARLDDGFDRWSWPTLWFRAVSAPRTLPGPVSWTLRFENAFAHFFLQPLDRHPALGALGRAVWRGDFRSFPEPLRAFYRGAGLSAVLALSGQHVGLLVGLVRMLLFPIRGVGLRIRAVQRWRRRWPYLSSHGLEPAAAGLLFLTSQAVAPMQRTVAHAAARAWLAARGLRAGAVSQAATAAGLSLVWDPGVLASPGFLLSALGALSLAAAFPRGAPAGWRGYAITAAVLPIVSFPLTAFWFGRIAWEAPGHQLVLAWAWSALWIPLGFLAPLIAALPAGLPDLGESATAEVWARFLEWQLKWIFPLGAGDTAVGRPTWFATLVAEMVLLCLVAAVARLVSGKLRPDEL